MCGSLWKCVEAYGGVWKSVKACGSLWKSTGTCGSVQKPVEVCGRLQKHVEACGSILHDSVFVHVWVCAHKHRCWWICMERVSVTLAIRVM